MKTKEELNALKEEVEALNKKLAELTDDELTQVVGGNWWPDYYGEDGYFKGIHGIPQAIIKGNNAE